MSGLLSNAISGLQASQVALRTAGNNISNANVAGYSRQVANFSTREEQRFGTAGFLGNGVNSDSVTRVVNDFVNVQLRLDTAAFNQLDKYNTNISAIDKMLSDASSGLSGALQTFFSSMQNAVTDPSSVPARQLVVTQTQSLANRYNTLYDRLAEAEKSANGEISTITNQIGALAKNIADLNQSIATKNASGSGSLPNDLLDQRDEALRKLSELASVQLIKQDGGDINVFIGNGEPLVVGPNVSKLSVKTDGRIYLANSITSAEITTEITGGQLGGLLQFKKDVISPTINQLGRIALTMADAFNTTQSQGLDLNGNYGNKMFTDVNDSALTYSRVAHGDNAEPNDRQIYLTIDDTSKLAITDYDFSIVKGSSNYVIKRKDNDAIISQGILSSSFPQEISFDGITLHLKGGSFQGGDTFTLQPTRTGSRDIKGLLSQPEELALALPIRTGKTGSNRGTGTVSAGEILSTKDLNGNLLPAFATAGKLSPPVIVHFTSATTYEVLDNTDPANPKPLVPAMSEQVYYPNQKNAIFTVDPGETKVIGNGARLGLPAGKMGLPNPLNTTPIYATSSAQGNGYPVEQYTFNWVDKNTNLPQSQAFVTQANASAAQTAMQLSNIPGVTARAYTTATITDINIDPNGFTYPLQISLNGENLIRYNGINIDSSVPNPNPIPNNDPKGNETLFNNYLVGRINENPNLQALGIRAESSNNPVTGVPEIHLIASSGVDLDVRLSATSKPTLVGLGYTSAQGSSISVNDSMGNPNVRLTGQDDNTGTTEQSAVTVGGRLDVTMANGISLTTQPDVSQILGDSTAANFAQSTYKGYQLIINGAPKAGDTFTLGFNTNSKTDNRNGLVMTALETKGTMQDGSLSFSQGYGRLVEEVGTKSNLSKINTAAAKSLLEQTQSMRDGVSGVNMDEEAANLIQYQQLYTANARVINMAKDLFDTLLQSIR